MSRPRAFASFAPILVTFACLVIVAAHAEADQIVLEPASVIGGSGSWNTNNWDQAQFNATYVADFQDEDEIDEPDQNPGDDNGGYWLGKENDEEEFFVLDLGQEYTIDQIDLYNTHNAQFDDRATNGYEIYGANEVEPIDFPDEPQAGGEDLVNAVLMAEGEMELVYGEDDPLLPQSADITNGGPFRYIRFATVGPFHEEDVIEAQRSVGINEIRVFGSLGGANALQAGDADQDLDFDQLDLVQVSVAAKYLSGTAATWGEGDWNGAPGGEQGNPPNGDGRFDQLDIIAALSNNLYLTGPYAAIPAGGSENDGQTSIVYNANTGEVSVDAPAGKELTSVNITSAASLFKGDKPAALDGAFDNFAADNIFKATFGGSFGSITFGNVLDIGLAENVVAGDLSAVGSLAGGGDLGNVDLVYIPEPVGMVLALLALGCGLIPMRQWRRRDRR